MYAAQALSRNEFAFVLMHIESDQPLAAIVRHDGAFPQPWARTDAPREIYALGELKNFTGHDGHYVALSSEGDVYYLDKKSNTEKIPGAGLASPDASGDGILSDITLFGDELWAVGWSGQAFRKRGADVWQRIPFEIASPPGLRRANLTHIAGLNSNDMYVCGTLTPDVADMDATTLQRLIDTEADQDAWEAAIEAAERGNPDARTADEGRIFHWDGKSFRQIETPVAPTIVFRSVFPETRDKVWVVGTAGTLLVGNAQKGFVSTGRFDKRQQFSSMTKLRDQYVLASEDGLWSFDGARAGRFKPPFQNAPLRPLKVQAVDDVLFYFDYIYGIHYFDAGHWEQIDVPQELYMRQFKGLRPR